MRGFRRYASRRQKPVRSAPPELKSSAEFERTVKTEQREARSRTESAQGKRLRLQASHSDCPSCKSSAHLFGGWEEIAQASAESKAHCTAAGFRRHVGGAATRFPARLAFRSRHAHALSGWRGCPRVNVAIISGRTLEDLRSKAGVPGVQMSRPPRLGRRREGWRAHA